MYYNITVKNNLQILKSLMKIFFHQILNINRMLRILRIETSEKGSSSLNSTSSDLSISSVNVQVKKLKLKKIHSTNKKLNISFENNKLENIEILFNHLLT